ncbi:hypothetical protein NDU88_002688 [Pleurodeles waltl]|uniref:Uncharacterized protein n=1 Tax=Pleurodeles waltl TaxID=8319 RepID=A0AAV7M445_PLEWA|nr:hypothetical protein NDU88_002688 [Pleurodeles waltl]
MLSVAPCQALMGSSFCLRPRGRRARRLRAWPGLREAPTRQPSRASGRLSGCSFRHLRLPGTPRFSGAPSLVVARGRCKGPDVGARGHTSAHAAFLATPPSCVFL